MLNITWREKAQLSPQPSRFIFWESYSFEPEFQDMVVHAWLSDSQAWGTDISRLLRQESWLKCSGCFLALGRLDMGSRTIQ